MLNSVKKIIGIFLILILTLSLSACDYDFYLYLDLLHEDTKVTKIELINYKNPIVKDEPLENHPLDLEKIEVLEILDNDDISNFMSKLIEIRGLGGKPREVLNSHNGTGIRIIRSDDSFTLITVMELAVANKNGSDAVFTGDYDADGNIIRVFGFSWQELTDDFKALINEYFTIQI